MNNLISGIAHHLLSRRRKEAELRGDRFSLRLLASAATNRIFTGTLPIVMRGLAAGLFLALASAHADDVRPVVDASGVTNAAVANTNLPTLFLVGDSTVRNRTRGQAGWGDTIAPYFDPARINVLNRALGGRSSRTFQTEGLWDKVLAEMKPGDFVLIQFGHNDGGELATGKRPRASLKGIGDETQEVTLEGSGQKEVVHTFGWYLRKYADDARAKGATPILCSLVPRKTWEQGLIVRHSKSYGKWAREIAQAAGVPFVDLNEIIARRYDELGTEKVEPLFGDEHTHTTVAGAELNAACVVAGLKGLATNPLAPFLSEKANALAAVPEASLAPAEGPKTAEVRPAPPAERIAPGAGARSVVNLDRDWCFSKGDTAPASQPSFDDSAWRRLNLPHDWSIEGPFGGEYASGSGFAPGGIGWYRKHFRLDPAATNRLVRLEFDGVYDHSQVWINGQPVGGRPYGYSSFACDLTPYLKYGTEENVIAVKVDHTHYADSRWYTGSGIYRHVRLCLTGGLRVARWGTFVTTPKVKKNAATVQIATTVANDTGAAAKFVLESEIVAPDGRVAGTTRSDGRLAHGTNAVIVQKITVAAPQLWSPDSPLLYTLRSRVIPKGPIGDVVRPHPNPLPQEREPSVPASGTTRRQPTLPGAGTASPSPWGEGGRSPSSIIDAVETPFGIRTLRFDANKGFFLNDVSVKLKGVCLHHDAGCLGAAVPAPVWERRLRTLKEMGCNAIRTSHNPPAPELLDLCDRLGFLVKDEAFDEFTPSKKKWIAGWNSSEPARFGYADSFAEWSVRDIQDMVRRDRNHPSIILWSIGNEIDYANDPFSHPVLGKEYHPENPPAENLVKLGRPLVAAVKELDRTRPVTAALANVPMSDAVGFGELLDVVGYNYQEPRYADDHQKYPKRILYGSENSHQHTNWAIVRDREYVFGQFLWTGIDYLGEAGRWPNRANGAGLLDLCGFKKPLAWYRQSLWSDRPMVYLAVGGGDGRRGRWRSDESWNWPSNSTVTVRCFTTCPEVQLWLNGRLVETRQRTNTTDGVLSWELPFEPGVLTAAGRDGKQTLCEFSLKTAGPAHHVELVPDTTQLAGQAGGVGHLEFRIVDAQGVRVPDAANEVTFSLAGPAVLLGAGNGDLSNYEDCKGKTHRAYQGRGLAILEATPDAGRITVTATSPGLESASATIESR